MNVPTSIRWAITLTLVALVIILSTIPGNAEVGDSTFVWLVVTTPTLLQKTMHFVIYGTLTTLCVWALGGVNPTSKRYVVAVVLAVGLGTALEIFQTMIPGRFGSFQDVLLNFGGVMVGLLLAYLALRH